MFILKCVLFSIILVYSQVQCAKILGIFGIPSISHQIVFQPIWKELSLRGHDVTVLTPNPLNDSSLVNLTEIDLSFSYELLRHFNIQKNMNKALPPTVATRQVYKIMSEISTAQLSDSNVQALIQDKSKNFDVMLVEFLVPIMYGFSARFRCPMIGITSMDATMAGHDAVGNPSHPLLNPDFMLPFMSMGWFERMYSAFYSIWFRYFYNYEYIPALDKIARKYIAEDIPYLGDIEKNVSMIFINTNPVFHAIRPHVPAVVQLGNMHITKKKSLPKDLQNELDLATEGVIYFSLGSNIKSASLSAELREIIIESLSELPYKVLWKWENDNLPNRPANVIIRKWFPQQDVLRHPNVKVFVTQGGLQSMEESISNGIPLVGMPFIADQPVNVRKMVTLGIARDVDVDTLTKEKLKSAIVDVAENPKYRTRVREISDISSDVPMTGLEKAIWWTEYVIRHKGARHLRSPAVDMPWYQYLLIDMISLVMIVTFIFIYVSYKLICFIIRLYLAKRKTKVS